MEVQGVIICVGDYSWWYDFLYENIRVTVSDNINGLAHNRFWTGGQLCHQKWGHSAKSNACYEFLCSNPLTGTLVTFQAQHRVQIQEMVVLTSECKGANDKPCIFPAKLKTKSQTAKQNGYMPACFESASNVFECATEVELDKVVN